MKAHLKTLAKALPPLQNRPLRSFIAAALILHFTLYTLHSPAAEPLSWVRKPNQPAPAQFDTFHGESLDFRCTFTGFGALPFSEGADVRLWYQTNGMGAAWWSIPATVSSNVLSAVWGPSADPGAERVAFFFGAPSNAYAAAQVRFRNSPGAHPNDLDPPSVLDWQAELAAATNALWESSAAAFMPKTDAYTKVETDARITELAPRTSLEPATNYTDSAVEIAYHDAVDYIDRVARRIEPKILTTNDVCNIVTATGNWEWTGPGTYIASASELPAEVSEGEICFTVNDVTWVDVQPGFEHWDVEITLWQWMIENDGWKWVENREFGQGFGYDEETDVLEVDVDFPAGVFTFTGRKRNALGLARPEDITNTVTKAYVEGLGIKSGVSEATVTNVVRSVAYAVNDYMWDGDVCWRRQMLKGGYLEYVAVTNIDVTLPENYKALESLEKARRNQE